MEVTLRKTKINASILKQMQHSSKDEIMTYKPLGYFIVIEKNQPYKKILLTNGSEFKLCFFARTFNFRENVLDVGFDHRKFTTFRGINFMDAEALKEQWLSIQKISLELGQIFY